MRIRPVPRDHVAVAFDITQTPFDVSIIAEVSNILSSTIEASKPVSSGVS
jgi:hypothetical protein